MESNNWKLIREYFSTPERPVTTAELRALTSDDRQQLVALLDTELGTPPEIAA